MKRPTFNKNRFILLWLTATLLAIPITWVCLPLIFPQRIPVTLELESLQEGEVQLRWGDSSDQMITLTPEKRPTLHRLEIVAVGSESQVRVEGLWDEKSRPIPLSELNFDQNWKISFDGMVVLRGSDQPAILIWEGMAGELTLRLLQFADANVHITWDGKEQMYSLYSQPDLVKFTSPTRYWQGELPSQPIERLWLRFGQGIKEGAFNRLVIASTPPQVWTAQILSERHPSFQGLEVASIEPDLHFKVTSTLGEVELPGFIPIKPTSFTLFQVLGVWLGVAGLLACGLFVAAKIYTVLGQAFPNSDDSEIVVRRQTGYPYVSQIALRFSNLLLAGRFGSLGFYIIFCFGIFLFLFATIHNRDISEIYRRTTPRYQQAIMVWIEHGYFRHGGLMFLEPVEANPTQELYSNTTMAYMQGAHLLERINYWFTGQYSYRLMSLHNQASVWFSSALLGFLAMRLARRLDIRPLHTLILGVACASVYQTFPSNLWYFWEAYPTEVVAVFALSFLLIEEVTFDCEQIPVRITLIRGLCVFAMFYVDYSITFFFVGTYVSAALILQPAILKKPGFYKTLLLPAALALGIYALQVLWVRINYPELHFVGSTPMFRTGFDGNTAPYVGDHFDLLFGSNRMSSPIYQWKYLFIAGVAALLLIIGLYLKVSQLRCALIILAVALGLYVPFAFMFSQAAIIHPYMYDVYLAIPLILALFAVLPAALEKLTKNPGTIVLLVIMMAFCYTMVQIRTYAMAFPLPNSPTGW